jgi:sulfite exporter TauE/SafE
MRVSGITMILAGPFALAMPFCGALPLAIASIFLGQLFSFFNTGPLNTALVNSTPASVREAAVGINIFLIHALGDALSPTLLGAGIGFLQTRGLSRADALGWAVASTAFPIVAGGILLLGRTSAPPAPAPERC